MLRALLLLSVVLLASAVVWAQEPTASPAPTARPTPTPPPLPKLLEPEMAKMRNMIRNASTKVRANVVGLSGTATRPAQICCSMNIEAIQAGVVALNGQLDQLGACYEAEADPQMRSNVEFVRSDLTGVRRALIDFSSADEKRRAVMAVDGLSKNYVLLLDSASTLRECPAPPPPGGGKKKKGKDKPPKES